MWSSNDPKWLLVAGPITLAVVGLLAYLHASNKEIVPKTAEWLSPKPLYVCEAPAWVTGNLDEALEVVKPWAKFSGVIKAKGPCSTVVDVIRDCEYRIDKEIRTVPCARGAVLLTGADQKFNFGNLEKGGHGDETLRHAVVTELQYVTALFPDLLQSISNASGTLDWPADIEVLVVAHALLHAEGYGHVVNDLPGPLYAEPTGHLMATRISKLGRLTEGL